MPHTSFLANKINFTQMYNLKKTYIDVPIETIDRRTLVPLKDIKIDTPPPLDHPDQRPTQLIPPPWHFANLNTACQVITIIGPIIQEIHNYII